MGMGTEGRFIDEGSGSGPRRVCGRGRIPDGEDRGNIACSGRDSGVDGNGNRGRLSKAIVAVEIVKSPTNPDHNRRDWIRKFLVTNKM